MCTAMLWMKNAFPVNRLSDYLMVLISTSLFFQCLGSPWKRFISEAEQQRRLRIGLHASLHLNSRNQPLKFDSISHERTLRDGVQETIEALPTNKPTNAERPNPFNHFGNGRRLTNPNNSSSSGSYTPSLPYQPDVNKVAGSKRKYRFVKGAKTESGMVKSYDTEPNLKTSMEKPQSFHKPSPIKALEKITDPHPDPIYSIKSKLEKFESTGQIESIKDRLIKVPLIPKIADIPSIDEIPAMEEIPSIDDSKSKINDFDIKGDGVKVGKRHALLTNKKYSVINLHFHTDFKSAKKETKTFNINTKGKPQEKIEIKRFLARKQPVVELKDHERKHKETAKHFIDVTGKHDNTIKPRKGRLHCILIKRGPLSEQCKTLTRSPQKERKLKRARNPGELTGTERIQIEPPKPIEPIDKIKVDFEAAKAIEDIQGHTIKVENIEKIEDIAKQLQDIKQQPKVHPITNCMLKIEPIPPIAPQQPIKNT